MIIYYNYINFKTIKLYTIFNYDIKYFFFLKKKIFFNNKIRNQLKIQNKSQNKENQID